LPGPGSSKARRRVTRLPRRRNQNLRVGVPTHGKRDS
jgi:hypothetical protein